MDLFKVLKIMAACAACICVVLAILQFVMGNIISGIADIIMAAMYSLILILDL